MAKKVIYGVKNLYYAIETDTGSALTYGDPVAWPGAVNFTCSPRVEEQNFEADDDDQYFSAKALKGFDIEIETAAIPEGFLTGVLGATLDSTDGTIMYKKSDAVKRVALLRRRTINIDGTEKYEDMVIYHCLPSMPSNWDAESSSAKAPKSVTISFSSSANPYTGATHCTTADTVVSATQSAWYTSVYQG